MRRNGVLSRTSAGYRVEKRSDKSMFRKCKNAGVGSYTDSVGQKYTSGWYRGFYSRVVSGNIGRYLNQS